MSKGHTVTCKLSEDQWKLARRRLFVDDLSWQKVLSSLINAYIMGDVHIGQDGKYHVNPPPSARPVITVPDSKDGEYEVDLGHPYRDNTNPRQATQPHTIWGTRQLQQHLQKETGRRIRIDILRQVLNELFDKEPHVRWEFKGPRDPRVEVVKEWIDLGFYDIMRREGLTAMKIAYHRRRREEQERKKVEKRYAESKQEKIDSVSKDLEDTGE